MDRHSSPFSMTLAFADPKAGAGGSVERRRPVERRRAAQRARVAAEPLVDTPTAVVIGALLWLLLGCSGLLWVIAFTSDTDSLVLALAVWVLAFVGPSVCATSLAYRIDPSPDEDAHRAAVRR